MPLRLLPVLLLLLAATAVHAQEIETAWLEVADVNLRLRSGPSSDDDVITRLTPREAVELLQRGEQWSQVRRQDGTAGWAHNDFLLPWDERNRPDARRRVGEQRLFNLYGGQNRYAELRSVSEHGYFYTVARRADDPLPNDEALQRLGAAFDERIYQQSLELWEIEDMPDIDGDERVVILLASGFDGFQDDIRGWYSRRGGPPQEPGTGIGYVAVALDAEYDGLLPDTGFPGLALARTHGVLAHEFGHLLHHHAAIHIGSVNGLSWVSEGLATFTANRMPLESTRYLDDVVFSAVPGNETVVDVQLNLREDPDYHAAMVFMTYIYERLGAQTLLDFATHRLQGLDALDALLAQRAEGFDADDFFADWVLANYLGDRERENGRFGYSRLTREEIHYVQPNLLPQLQTGIRDSSPPYATVYYELPLSGDMTADNLLLLDFRLTAPPPQDAWVQFVQVLPGRIDVQRFRAGDYPDRPMAASLGEAPQRAFVAISPFGARRRTQPVHWSLTLRLDPLSQSDRAQVTTTLNLRSAPEIADNVLGKLQRCSVVQVLQRGEAWSQVLNADGLGGWAHNDWLVHRNAPAPGASANPCAALSRAAHDGNLAAVQGLLAGGADVNGRDAWGRSALHEAAFMGHDDVIARLLRAGADVHAQDVAGRMPIDEVLRSGNFNNIQLLQAAGVEFDLGSPAIQPLVVEAAGGGNDVLLGALLDSGHDVDWRDASGRSALTVATANGRERTVRTLINAGADVTLTDEEGHTPFMQAAADGNLVLLERIHRAGVDANRVDHEGHNALTLAAANGQAMNVAWLLLSTDVDVNHTLPDSGRTALHLAAAGGHADTVAMLLLDAAAADLPDAEGFTPLQLAGAGGHAGAATRLNMVQAEQGRRSELPKLDDAYFPDFLAAARSGNLAEVERLLAAGAPFNKTDREGFTALMYAVRAGHRDVALRLLLAGADPDRKGDFLIVDESAIFLAITEGYDDLSAMMLLGGATGRVGFTPAMEAAAGSGREDVVRLLLDTKTRARTGIETRDATGLTPLLQAASFNHTRLVEMLIDSGADLNARAGPAFYNFSALDFANRNGNQEMVDLLLEAGAEA